MCMGYAKDIAVWACETELNRRLDVLSAWGEALLEQDAEPVKPTDHRPRASYSVATDEGTKDSNTREMG
jgi:hypothetical protein